MQLKPNYSLNFGGGGLPENLVNSAFEPHDFEQAYQTNQSNLPHDDAPCNHLSTSKNTSHSENLGNRFEERKADFIAIQNLSMPVLLRRTGGQDFSLPAKLAAFTLTEVLLAILIVGIIAALVLPAVVTKYQENVLEHAYTREVKSIENSLLSLAVNENKTSFFDTMMYSENEPESYADNAEKYMKKYLRVSKYCGENTGSGCFAKKYYTYKDNDKTEYTPEYKGACGVLKNGTSICITPQVGGTAVSGILDLNGAKGPNVLNKDLRTFTLSTQTRHGKSASTQDVIALDNPPITPDNPEPEPDPDPVTPDPVVPEPVTPTDPCTTDPGSLDCCKTKTITSSTDSCCTYSYYNSNTTCHPQYKYTVTVTYAKYCTHGCLCDFYVAGSSISPTTNLNSSDLNDLDFVIKFWSQDRAEDEVYKNNDRDTLTNAVKYEIPASYIRDNYINNKSRNVYKFADADASTYILSASYHSTHRMYWKSSGTTTYKKDNKTFELEEITGSLF